MSGRLIFSTGRAMHYSGGLQVGNTTWAAGYACCCSGNKAMKIREFGNQTDDRSKVNCKSCLRQLKKEAEHKVVRTVQAPCFQCELDIGHVCYKAIPGVKWGLES